MIVDEGESCHAHLHHFLLVAHEVDLYAAVVPAALSGVVGFYGFAFAMAGCDVNKAVE
jgi:hypothetical protein